MEAHVIPLHPTVRLEGDRIVIERLSISDPTLAAFLGERPAAERGPIAERALRIGLIALQDAGVTVNVDAVRSEFERMMRQAEQVNERAATALEQTLRANFADGDGRLPRTLERFLGDRGALRSMVDELFDEKKRDSAIGRIGSMLERYFDGDASKLALLLDPTRLNSPMHQFRQEITAGFKGIEERHGASSELVRRPRVWISRTCWPSCSGTSPVAPETSSTGRPSRPATSCARRRATSCSPSIRPSRAGAICGW
jgi:hypothetical protein